MRSRSRLTLPLLTVTLVLLALATGRVVAVITTTPEGPKRAALYQRVGRERFHAAERLVRSFYEDGDSGDVLAAAVPGSLVARDRRLLRESLDAELAEPFGEPVLNITNARDVELVRVSTERVDWCVDPSLHVLIDCQVGVGVMTGRVERAPVVSDGAFLGIHDSFAALEIVIATRREPYRLEGGFRLDSPSGVPRPVESPEVLIGTPAGDFAPITGGDVIHVPARRVLLVRFYGPPGIEGSEAGLVDDHVLRWDGGAVHLSIDLVQWFVGLDESVSA